MPTLSILHPFPSFLQKDDGLLDGEHSHIRMTNISHGTQNTACRQTMQFTVQDHIAPVDDDA